MLNYTHYIKTPRNQPGVFISTYCVYSILISSTVIDMKNN